jgi:hypothetical protein
MIGSISGALSAIRHTRILLRGVEYVSGRLTGVANLASGRFTMIEDGLGFQLVPWQPVLEKRLDQHISGVRRDDGGIEWSFSRKRQIGLGL